MVKVLTISNFKGGVGKSTTNVLFSYLLATNKNKKVLLIDFDPQSNSSEIIAKTFPNHIVEPKLSFFEGLKKTDLTQSITKFTGNLDMLVADWKLVGLPDMLEDYKRDERRFFLRELLKPIKDNYDYILIDTPPTLSDYTNNAILASDWVIAVLQTQEQAYSSTLKFIAYLQDLAEESNSNFDLLGVIQYLVKINGKVDEEIINDAQKNLGVALFHYNIFQRERVKRFGRSGITNNDLWDKRVLYMYEQVLDEAILRMED
ncbi:ParA family protein [Liquorilactobacillus vini]|uniref:ParA family protein n=1 Tax=Liquorilactobacillus vini TaxID=238015 RepID=UPI00030074B7|nr:ParA family protein [Liquorilactobacillus vini]